MKDAKGHGSNPRGAHQARVESIPDRRAVELRHRLERDRATGLTILHYRLRAKVREHGANSIWAPLLAKVEHIITRG